MARLIFVTGTSSSVAEGSGTWVGISGLRDAIVALGHEVVMVTPDDEHTTTRSRIRFNVRIRKTLRSIRADAIIGFDLDGVFAPRKGALHVAAIKGVLADEAKHEGGIERLALTIQARLEARHVRHADRVVTTSAYSAGRIASFYGIDREKIAIVPELIDLDAWDRALAGAPREQGPPRILTVAHLYPRKGVDTLLRAFATTPRDAVLRIVGSGPERERLEELSHTLAIADRVHFLGHLPFTALAAEYRNATLFALPTEQEGFGIVFLEAMASGLPIIATRVAAVPEVVSDGVTALLANPGDESTLAQLLETLLGDAALRKRLGDAGRAHVARFAAPVVARQFLAAIGIT
ncbi:MAG: glycosyltransferase family 4 protein [Acidobacteria bacterium]|nr:glycosyltransferase family 4 protein [Acidobacteriota bacterium]MBV9068386.1 glycosyltransferase family 4 protein [Acidobacteriota bacterium]MBV9186138.1 glycosyltransferase family 4 protein [Acidobacteriota bacterium]